MVALTSRKLAAIAIGVVGLLILGALQVFGNKPLTDQEFNLLAAGVSALSGGGTLVQGVIDFSQQSALTNGSAKK